MASSTSNSDCENNLGKSGKRNGEKTVHTVGDIRETDSELLGKVSWEFNISIMEEHTNNSSHGNTPVLTLNGTTTLEVSMEGSKLGSGVLLRVKPSKGIVKSKRLGNSDGWVKRVNTFGLKSTGLLHSSQSVPAGIDRTTTVKAHFLNTSHVKCIAPPSLRYGTIDIYLTNTFLQLSS